VLEVVGEEAAGERVARTRGVDEVVAARGNVRAAPSCHTSAPSASSFSMISAFGYSSASAGSDLRRLGEPAGEHAAFLLVGQEDVDAEVLRDREEVVDAHLADHLERAGVERERGAAGLREMRGLRTVRAAGR
jgi:hypothetical protein